MKIIILITATLFLTVACSTTASKDLCRGEHPFEAPDHSTSPLTHQQAAEIAKKTISCREHWPDWIDSNNIYHTVVFESYRINKGRWKVIAHKSVIEGGSKANGNIGFDSDSPGQAMIIINRNGSVKGYSTKPISPWDQ